MGADGPTIFLRHWDSKSFTAEIAEDSEDAEKSYGLLGRLRAKARNTGIPARITKSP